MKQILLVDDDATFRQVLARRLQRSGYQTHEAADCQSAISLAQQHNFGQALVDLRLPGDSGLMVVQQLKALQPDCVIVLLTGFASIATAVEAIKLGASDYLTKPADTAAILKALEGESSEVALEDQPLTVDRLEWEHIQKVLLENDNNISATARALNMHRRTLQRKLGKNPAR